MNSEKLTFLKLLLLFAYELLHGTRLRNNKHCYFIGNHNTVNISNKIIVSSSEERLTQKRYFNSTQLIESTGKERLMNVFRKHRYTLFFIIQKPNALRWKYQTPFITGDPVKSQRKNKTIHLNRSNNSFRFSQSVQSFEKIF